MPLVLKTQFWEKDEFSSVLVRVESPLGACEEAPLGARLVAIHYTQEKGLGKFIRALSFPCLPPQHSYASNWTPKEVHFSSGGLLTLPSVTSSSKVAWQHSQTVKVLFPWHSRANFQSAIRQQSYLCALFSGESLAFHQEILGCGFLNREWEIWFSAAGWYVREKRFDVDSQGPLAQRSQWIFHHKEGRWQHVTRQQKTPRTPKRA